MDILAALPTPPHNQNEDIRCGISYLFRLHSRTPQRVCFASRADANAFRFRMESDDDSDAPDSIIPASSPESDLGEEASRFPHLREPKEEESERAISPVIPLIPQTAIPSKHAKQMVKENILISV